MYKCMNIFIVVKFLEILTNYVYSFARLHIEVRMHFVKLEEDYSYFGYIFCMILKMYISNVGLSYMMLDYFHFCLLRSPSFTVIYVYAHVFSGRVRFSTADLALDISAPDISATGLSGARTFFFRFVFL